MNNEHEMNNEYNSCVNLLQIHCIQSTKCSYKLLLSNKHCIKTHEGDLTNSNRWKKTFSE